MKNQRKNGAAPTYESLLSSAAPDARERLEEIQQIVEQRVAGAKRCVSYGMPAFRLGTVFFYFASFKKHIGVYPPVGEPASLVDELQPFRGPNGNLIFRNSEPLPVELIGRVAEALADQYAADATD